MKSLINYANNMLLSKKLVLAFFVFLILFSGTNVYSIYQMKQMSQLTSKLYNHPYTVSNTVREINYYIVSMHRSMKDVALAKNSEQVEQAVSKVNSHEEKVYKSFEILEERFLGSKEKVMIAKKSFMDWKKIRDEVIYLVKNGKSQEAAEITKGKGAIHVEEMYDKMSYLTSFATKKGISFFQDTKKIESNVFNTTIIISFISFILIILIAITIITNVKKKMNDFESGLLSFFRYLNREDLNMIYLNDEFDDEFGHMSKVINKNISYTTANIEKEKKLTLMMQQQSKLAAMGEMVGAIAHQWRQPLNELSIRIQKIKRDYYKGKVDELYIDDLTNGGKKTIDFMSKTIDNFRNFFRIDKEKVQFNVEGAIEEVLNMFQAQLKNHHITVETNLVPINVYGFRSEFQQGIINILNNAKDALIQNNIKEPKITISLNKDIIEIVDNAGGIPDEILDRIFEPYFTTKDQGMGTGMGLYLTKMIIEDNMDGKVEVYNNGVGAVFRIIFNKG